MKNHTLAIKKLELSFIASILLSTTNIYADYDFGCEPPKNVTGTFEELNSKLEANPKDESAKKEMNELKLEMKCASFEHELNGNYNSDYKQTSSNEAIFKSLKFLQNYKSEIAQKIIDDLKSNQIKNLEPLGIKGLFGLDIGYKTDGRLYIGLFTLKGNKPEYEQKRFPVRQASVSNGVSFNDLKEPYQTNKISTIRIVKDGKLATIKTDDFKLNDDSEAFIFGNEIARALHFLNFENKTPQKYKEYLQSDEFATKQAEELERQQAEELEKEKRQAEEQKQAKETSTTVKPSQEVLNGKAGKVCYGGGCEKSDGNPSSNNYEYHINKPPLINNINWNRVEIKAGNDKCQTGSDPQVFCEKIEGNAQSGYKLKESKQIGSCNSNQHKDGLNFKSGDQVIPLTEIEAACVGVIK